MPALQQELWHKIETFSLDRTDATLTFTKRLARENGWSHEYATRVGDEYKRFMFLCVTAGHVVSPSAQVDQAWHLHLTYTRSYWQDFCGKVLGRPVHHDPTTGIEEQQRFVDLYNQTLQSYSAHFGQNPPSDIWPPAGIRFGEDLGGQWINRVSHWVIPKPRLPGRRGGPFPSLLLGLAIVPLAALNPFNFNGPQFLVFYALLLFVALLAAFVLRHKLRDIWSPPDDRPVNPTKVAFIAGGLKRGMQAAIAGMLCDGSLETGVPATGSSKAQGGRRRQRLFGTAKKPTESDLLVNTIHETACSPTGASPYEIGAAVKRVLGQYELQLAERGLIHTEKVPPWRWVGSLIVLVVGLVGFIKILVGVGREKPVGYLVFAVVVTGILGLLLMLGSRATRKGQALLQDLRTRNVEFRQAVRASRQTAEPAEIAMAVGLFGVGVLSSSPHTGLQSTLQAYARDPQTFGGSEPHGVGCGVGCGGGGCGGGGCGGGGCGGGCGGCGG